MFGEALRAHQQTTVPMVVLSACHQGIGQAHKQRLGAWPTQGASASKANATLLEAPMKHTKLQSHSRLCMPMHSLPEMLTRPATFSSFHAWSTYPLARKLAAGQVMLMMRGRTPQLNRQEHSCFLHGSLSTRACQPIELKSVRRASQIPMLVDHWRCYSNMRIMNTRRLSLYLGFHNPVWQSGTNWVAPHPTCICGTHTQAHKDDRPRLVPSRSCPDQTLNLCSSKRTQKAAADTA